jgi:hypothetical protein
VTRHPLTWLLLSLGAIILLTLAGPSEKSLGPNVRVVYLHGAWVWTSLAVLIAAGVTGLVGILMQKPELHAWSRALGRTGLLFWITYLPISLWAMQSNWNGLYLAEPRWRLALIFGVSGLLLQTGLTLIEDLRWTSIGNIAFVAILLLALSGTQEVMHPRAPILTSDSRLIRAYFGLLVSIALMAAWQIARWWRGENPLN